MQLINLAIDWDALDVAKEHIIKDDLSEIRVKMKISKEKENVFLVSSLGKSKERIISESIGSQSSGFCEYVYQNEF